MKPVPVLHGYWRSGAAYRVRIALALKGIEYEQINHDLRTGAQRTPDYLALNPQGFVPVLEAGELRLTQSLAIIEWLEEAYPAPALLPRKAEARAIVRSMAQLVCCDIHPLDNLRVLNSLRQDFGASEAQVHAWIGRWIRSGFDALESAIRLHGGGFAYGDGPTIADCCIVPQVYAAHRFAVDLIPYPAIEALFSRCSALAAFQRAHPDAQEDAPRQG